MKLQKSQVWPLVPQDKTQHSQCPRAGHIWEGQFVLSKLRHTHQEQSCLFTGDTGLSGQRFFWTYQYAPCRPATQDVKIPGKLGIWERQFHYVAGPRASTFTICDAHCWVDGCFEGLTRQTVALGNIGWLL